MLTADRNTIKRAGEKFSIPLAANAIAFAGGIVCVATATGFGQAARTALGLIAVGRANQFVDNTGGANGAVSVEVERGVFRYDNSAAADLITLADVGQTCWLVDDEQVARTSGGGTRSPAGFVVDVDAQGVWVLIGYGIMDSPAGALVAANNLGDLVNAATSRGNLGGGSDKILLSVGDIDLIGANAQVRRIVSPVAGNIVAFQSVLENIALAVGNATLTLAINGVAVTDGAITITQAGSAAGDVDAVAPSANRTVAIGDVITITVGGTNTAAALARANLRITPSA